jgi:hypothetical protein
LVVIWVVSTIFLWAARAPMLRMLHGLSDVLRQGFDGLASRCRPPSSP